MYTYRKNMYHKIRLEEIILHSKLFHCIFLSSLTMLGAQGASFVALFVFAYASWMSEDDCGAQENISVGSSRWLRMSIFLLSSSLVGTCAIITLVSTFIALLFFVLFLFFVLESYDYVSAR